jgi:DNA-binding IclR family transcriptional regulator
VPVARKSKPSTAPDNPQLRTLHRVRESGDRQFVAALARGLAILRCFRSGDRYLGNQEIARRTGLAKPTVSRLTHTLTRVGFLSHSPLREEYALGAGVLALGHAYLAALNMRELARPMMQEVADFAKATISLGENDGQHMVIVEICHGSPTYRLRLDVGQRVPHNTTALGRAYLAAMSPEQRAQRVDSICRGVQPAAARATLHAEIHSSLRSFDKQGFVYSFGDWNPEIFALGVPLISVDRTRVMALSCSGAMFDVTRKKLVSEYGPRMVTLRDRIYEAARGVF